ncbi:MAG: BACON domain-containing protein [Lachnospiraceae bacterium]|nr:BACON domain-containing protein [Lachnospiraceae bacterium]
MKQNNMGNWKQCLAARVLAVVLMLVLVGTTIPGTALAQKAGSGASVQNAVTTADIVVKDANGKVVDEIVFDGGVNNSKGVPAQRFTVSGSGVLSVKSYNSWIKVSISGNTIKVQVEENYTGRERKGSVAVIAGSKKLYLPVNQRIFKPNIIGYRYLFGTPTVTDGVINAYKPFAKKSTVVASIRECDRFSLAWEVSKMLGVSFPKEFYVGRLSELVEKLNRKQSYYESYMSKDKAKKKYEENYSLNALEGVYAKYIADEDVMIINITNAYTAELYTMAVLHEFRHKWQWEYNHFSETRTQYLIRYNLEDYRKGVENQIVEVDTDGYVSRVMNILKSKVK